MDALVNIDVPDLGAAVAFYTATFGLSVTRHLGPAAAELAGGWVPLYLLKSPPVRSALPATPGATTGHRTPVHLDVVVEDHPSLKAPYVP